MRSRLRNDSGLSLIEMMVAVGVLGVLMALVSAFFVNAYGGIRNASGLSQVQQEQRNAMLRIATALRYADDTTLISAGDDSIVFYSRARMEPNQTLPNRVSIYVTSAQPNPGLVVSTLTSGVAQPVTTTAVRTEPGHTPKLSFTYLNAKGETLAGASRSEAQSVHVRLTDTPSGLSLDETVVLVNRQ